MSVPDHLFYDKNAPIESWSRDLPHLSQSGKIQFVTFHLGDSIPRDVREEIISQKKHFLSQHPQPWSTEIKILYTKLFSRKVERYLDSGYGSCLFNNSRYRNIMSEALNIGHPELYNLLAYVIMPNHVHLLAIEYEEKSLKRHIGNIRRYTSTKINQMLNRKGSLWDKEPFDTLVRNEGHYYNCLNYILRNPKFLHPSHYELGGWEIERRKKQ